MKARKIFQFILLIPLLLGALSVWSPSSHAQTADGENTSEKGDSPELLKFKREGKDQETNLLLDKQERDSNFGTQNVGSQNANMSADQSRSQQMVNLLKDDQLQKAMLTVTKRGNDIVDNNPELKNPLTVIAGAVSLWYGRSVNLLKSTDFSLSSRFSGRERSGELSTSSPLLNGSLKYNPSNGIDLSINRSISSIQTSAELKYNVQSQGVTSQIRHHLMPNLDLSVGTTQMPNTNQPDNRAGVEYQIHF